jgi:hypothetical protein
MRKLTLKNEFHNREVTLNIDLKTIKEGATFELTPNQIKRANRELCGIKDCCCGGVAGQRADWHKIDDKEVSLEIQEKQRGYYNKPVNAVVIITGIWQRD